jgi:hypothetical protein
MKVHKAKFPTGHLSPRGTHVLKRGRQQSNCTGVMGRLIRLMFAMLIATVLIGAPVVQAAVTMSCDTTVASMADHRPSGHSQAPTPCKEKMPGCADVLSCGFSASLNARITIATNEQVWASAVYWPIADLLEGLVVKPDLGPPITI